MIAFVLPRRIRIPAVRRARIALAGGVCAALAVAALPARHALSAYAYGLGGDRHAEQATVAVGTAADDRFPGAALAYLDGALPPAPRAPAATGYFDIPASLAATAPADAEALTAGMVGVIAAPALAFRAASGADAARAAQCLATAIYYEAASESDDGQRAVAQVVLNRVRHPAFPDSVCGVVYQGSERSTGCQFSFTCDGALARAPSRTGWTRAMRIALDALGGTVYAPVGHATHYHTFRVWPYWGKSLVMTGAVGAHLFHRWKGFWGTPPAFRDRYAGVEPAIPAWRPRTPADPLAMPVTMAGAATGTMLVPATPFAAAAPMAVPLPAAAPVTAATEIRPEHQSTGQLRAEALPDSQILDRWKDSGTPLR